MPLGDKAGNARITTTPDGLTITDKSEKSILQERTFVYANGREIKLSFDDKHKVSAIADSNGELNYNLTSDEKLNSITSAKGNDTIIIKLKDGTTQVVDGQGNCKALAVGSTADSGRDLEGRLLINQVPDGAEDTLFKQVLETSEWKVSVTDDFRAWSLIPIVKSDYWLVNAGIGALNFGPINTLRLNELKNASADGGRFDIKQKGVSFKSMVISSGGQNRADALTIKAGYDYYRKHMQAKVEAEKLEN